MASKITIPDLKKIRVTDPLFSHYAGMVAKKMIPVQWEILNGKQGQSRCFCIDNFRIAGGTLQGEHRGVVFGDTRHLYRATRRDILRRAPSGPSRSPRGSGAPSSRAARTAGSGAASPS